MNKKIDVLVIDYNSGNLGCICNALCYLNFNPILVKVADIYQFNSSDYFIVIPGVGNFQYASKSIDASLSLEKLSGWASRAKKLLCICLGYQLLFASSSELSALNVDNSPFPKGLGLFQSNVRSLSPLTKPVLNVGWRRNMPANLKVSSCKIYDYLIDHCFYHMHSFGIYRDEFIDQDLNSVEWYVTGQHLITKSFFIAAFKAGNILALQFHPEKSGSHGLELIKSFFSLP